jgi:hypothetical protein
MGFCGIVEKVGQRGRFLTVRCSDGSYAVFRAAAPSEVSPGDVLEWQANTFPIILGNLSRDGRPIAIDGARYCLPAAVAAALAATLARQPAPDSPRPSPPRAPA